MEIYFKGSCGAAILFGQKFDFHCQNNFQGLLMYTLILL